MWRTVEQQQIAIEWNDTDEPFTSECMHVLFEQHSEKSPNDIALVFQGVYLTYGYLNSKCNILAHRLIQVGVQIESTVGITLERRPPLVMAILGVLKSGGAYVPLDPSYPKERLMFMMEDCDLSFVITQRMYDGLFEDFQGVKIYVEDLFPEYFNNTSGQITTVYNKKETNKEEINLERFIHNPNIPVNENNLFYISNFFFF